MNEYRASDREAARIAARTREADGARYVEAIRGARSMRSRAYGAHGVFADGNYGRGAYLNERLCGIPETWHR
jgi:hypothetical protein